MQTLNELRATLGIGSLNQIRNRIDAIRDQLRPHMKRGPNNQILIEDEGIRLLQWLQELHDSGLTIAEASKIVELKSYEKGITGADKSSGLGRNTAKRDHEGSLARGDRLPGRIPSVHVGETSQIQSEVETLRFEVAALRERVTRLEGIVGTQPVSRETGLWWESVEEG